MQKFIVSHHKGTTTILEVECEEIFCQPWELLPGEKKYIILSIKDTDGKNPIYYSHSVFDSEALALNAAAGDLRKSMEMWEAKGKEAFNEQLLIKQVAAIVVKKLENVNA
jgi:hypothetical protein